ncbi:MAG: hypothetical protein HC831_26590 [Chloroflexia bacterium]|nr:hypothetical protein [Chloroflexia bacterium]
MIEGATVVGEDFYGSAGTWNGFDKSQLATRKIDHIICKKPASVEIPTY